MAKEGVGRIIDNKYEILASIGQGGMSYVWLGRDKRLNKLWAIKELRDSAASAQGAANRKAIVDEANFIKRLDHPAIPRVVDIVDTGASVFVVMDFVNGTALNKALRQQGRPFEQERVIEWGIQLCDVLEYLHGLKNPVVYRDMKPSNVMLRGDNTVKLVDFGIAMELLPSGPSDARVIGTGGYGAPEQVNEEVHKTTPVDTRTDVYALGTTLYSLVTGHVPRMRTDQNGKALVDFEMRPIREWDAQLSEGLEHILQRATEQDPRDRYQTITEMQYDLEHYQELTQEYRAVQQKKVAGFRHRLAAAGVACCVGVVCLVVSLLLRNTSYDALVHEASVAQKTERNEVVNRENGTRTADASQAEELYSRAIEVDPNRIDTYFDLIDLYESDNLFTATEASRWSSVWQSHGRQLENDPHYNKLCYNVGILYLVYFDYADARSIADDKTAQAATGQAAVENTTQAIRWFEEVVSHSEPAVDRMPSESGKDARSLTEPELNAAQRYVAMGDFYNAVTKANREGADITSTYKSFWRNTLVPTVIGTNGQEALVARSEPIVQLRVYQIAFESVCSATYLAGFRRAEVSRQDASDMLDVVCDATKALQSFVAANSDSSKALYNEIVGGESQARANIDRVYKNDYLRTVVQEEREAQA